MAVGDPAVRRRLVDEITAASGRFASVVHPAATVGSAITLGEGVIVCAGAAISTNVRMGDHVHVNPNATIGHDAVLEPFVSVNPGAIVSGEVLVGEGVLIGAGAVVLQGLTIGEGAVVGAAGCVVRDVPPRTIVKAYPPAESEDTNEGTDHRRRGLHRLESREAPEPAGAGLVTAVDHRRPQHRVPDNLDGVEADFIEASFLDPDARARAVAGIDAVVHLGAIPSVPRSVAAPMPSHAANATGTPRSSRPLARPACPR